MSDALVNGLAGAGGGIIAQILTYPLQAVNTRQQTERKAKRTIEQAYRADIEQQKLPDGSNQKKLLGTYVELCKVIRDEGWGGILRGLTPSLVGTAASQGVYYYFYQIFKNEAEAIAVRRKKKPSNNGTVGVFSSLIIAALAGCLNVLLTNPIWVVVTRMQTHAQAQKKLTNNKRKTLPSDESREQSSADTISIVKPYGTLEAVRDLYAEAGVSGFWKGVCPSLVMVCNPSIQFMLYEGMMKQLRSRRSTKKQELTNVTALEVFLMGAIAKLGATIATYPLLVVKSRLQAKQEIGGDEKGRYSGTVDAILKMIRFEGLQGFYKGMGTKILQSVFAAAVLFMIKEELVKLIQMVVLKNRVIVQNSKAFQKEV